MTMGADGTGMCIHLLEWGVPVGDEILLTPGRCRVVREALGNFEFGLVGIIMAEENELLVGDAAEFEKVIEDMIKEFE
jgi:hypothetical protein